MMSVFADDAVVIDPHFPTPQMQGKAAITEGFREAMTGMRSFGYTIVNYFESENGQRAAVETATHHVVKQGMKLNFPQVFIFEAADGRITRMQAYEPYGPRGIMGLHYLRMFNSKFQRSLTTTPLPCKYSFTSRTRNFPK
jgi:ketosteroid isomerase-like protein